MAEDNVQVPKSFWIISSLALVWNLIGVANYVMQVTMTPEDIALLPEGQRTLVENVPTWATAAFATATSAGTLGSVLLLARSLWATPLFLLSLAAVFVQMYHAFVIADAISVVGPSAAALPAVIIAIGAGLIWYARYAKEKGWLR